MIELGAADSQKFVPSIEAFIGQGRICTYVPLDLNQDSLLKHVRGVKDSYTQDHHIPCVSLWGTFIHGGKYYYRIMGQKLFLSLGGIFPNAPDAMCHARLKEFDEQLGPDDALIVGQDGPTGEAHLRLADKAYNTEPYFRFVNNYLKVMCEVAGIKVGESIREYWRVEGVSRGWKHYFETTASIDMVCTKLENLEIEKGTVYELFPSCKGDQKDIERVVVEHNLTVSLIGKVKNSGMCQYLIQKKL